MKSSELNLLLLKRFPSLKEAFEEETSWQEGINTGSIVVFEDVFMPYIIHCVENKLNSEVTEIFKFIEECVKSNDEYQRNVIEVSIIENMHSYDIADQLSSFLLEESLASYKKI